ncbi:MAG: lantibiotic dehydratase [Streptosporangiales bacterium]|nr:lantibiotic dehydratase [Streptosporangiales bacterium]
MPLRFGSGFGRLWAEESRRMYRHAGKALLRASRASARSAPEEWPDLSTDADAEGWRTWLLRVWSRRETAEAITLASPPLARRVEEICAGKRLKAKEVRSAVVSVVRYVLRETARPTPFGLFAGAAPMEFGPVAKARWGHRHRVTARADAEWLADVIAGLETCPELLERLPVMVNNLRSVRGGRLALLSGSTRVEIRYTPAVRAVERAAHVPIRFSVLAQDLADEFPAASPSMIREMLTELVAQRFLVTSLRPPATVVDALAHVIDQLREVGAEDVATVAATVRELRAVQADLDCYGNAAPGEREQERAQVVQRMRGLSQAGKSPMAVDLRLDCDVKLPEEVAHEMEAAASALLRLTRQPSGKRAWRDYHAVFVDRYGVGAVVPVAELVNPDTGLGFPAGYPGSSFDPPTQPSRTDRDDRLLALVHQAALTGRDEIVLDDEAIADLAGDVDTVRMPPHVELSARIHAGSLDALDRGEFTLTVSPARAAGTMTGRFTPDPSTGLGEVYASLPTLDDDAIPAQLSFPPAYAHAENISRTPRFLYHVIALGEHRAPGEDGVIPLEDLAVTADWHRLRLVSLSLRRPVEPQVFHALRLDKQPPPIARFLANLPRGSVAAYTEFDWGTALRLPYLPRVRYGRAVLSPAQWRISAADLTTAGADWPRWRAALGQWQHRWRLPEVVELRDADRVLRLDLTQPAHAAILRTHLERSGEAVLTEAGEEAGLGWLDGHAHEIAVPLMSTGPVAPSPLADGRPLIKVANTDGHLPGSPESEWLYCKVYVHADRQTEVIAEHLPRLLDHLDGAPHWWFLRYRDLHDPDHLRLRIRVANRHEYGAYAITVGAWTDQMRREGLTRRLVLDTYCPEFGRYGDGPAMAAAESVFAADSAVVLTQLRHIPEAAAPHTAVTAANIVDIACGFSGSIEAGMGWLIDHARNDRPAPAPRAILDQAVALADPSRDFAAMLDLPGGETLAAAWARRRAALAAYRQQLPNGADTDSVLDSLLHLHHVRALGLDRDSERLCRRLARSAALAWRAKREHR